MSCAIRLHEIPYASIPSDLFASGGRACHLAQFGPAAAGFAEILASAPLGLDALDDIVSHGGGEFQFEGSVKTPSSRLSLRHSDGCYYLRFDSLRGSECVQYNGATRSLTLSCDRGGKSVCLKINQIGVLYHTSIEVEASLPSNPNSVSASSLKSLAGPVRVAPVINFFAEKYRPYGVPILKQRFETHIEVQTVS